MDCARVVMVCMSSSNLPPIAAGANEGQVPHPVICRQRHQLPDTVENCSSRDGKKTLS